MLVLLLLFVQRYIRSMWPDVGQAAEVDEAGRQLTKVTHDCWQAAIEYCKPGQPYNGIGAVM